MRVGRGNSKKEARYALKRVYMEQIEKIHTRNKGWVCRTIILESRVRFSRGGKRKGKNDSNCYLQTSTLAEIILAERCQEPFEVAMRKIEEL